MFETKALNIINTLLLIDSEDLSATVHAQENIAILIKSDSIGEVLSLLALIGQIHKQLFIHCRLNGTLV
jgi:hypothetical protein